MTRSGLLYTIASSLLLVVSAQSSTRSAPSTSITAGPTLSLLLPGFENQTVWASVIDAKSSSTTLSLACASGVDSNDCGVPPNVTYVLAPSAIDFIVNDRMSGQVYYVSVHCTSDASSHVVCTETDYQVLLASETGTALTTMTSSNSSTLAPSELQTIPVTITAGAEKLSSASSGAHSAATSSVVPVGGAVAGMDRSVVAGGVIGAGLAALVAAL